MDPSPDKRRWLGFGVLSLGTLMIVLDTTIVNVALPSLRADLGFSEAQLAWVVNAYLLTFGGFLLLGGRLGDLFGARRVFLVGIVVFTAASLACGLATTRAMLIAARAVQGLGGAVVSAVALALIVRLFPEPEVRAKAMGFYGFVAAGGGSLGLMLGGFLTGALDWHWVFLVNLPIGLAVFMAARKILPEARDETQSRHLDIGGALLITTALLLAVYAVVNTTVVGWTAPSTLTLLAVAGVLIGAFLVVESRVAAPLMPLGLFRRRRVATANVAGVLWAAGMFAWFFLSALYMGAVLGYTPLQVGLGFLVSNVIMAIFSVGLSARLVNRFGVRPPLVVGLLLASAGLLSFTRLPVAGAYWLDVFPGMVLLGFGAGMAFNPLLLAAMDDVPDAEAGLASGVVNTSFMMGGALGLAVLASVAATRTADLVSTGTAFPEALTAGYRVAFLIAATCAGTAALLGAIFLRPQPATALMPAPHAATEPLPVEAD